MNRNATVASTPWTRFQDAAYVTVICAFCWPCVSAVACMWQLRKRSEKKEKIKKEFQRRKPPETYYDTSDANIYAQSTFGLDVLAPPLLRPKSPRQRALSISSVPEEKRLQRTYDQAMSLFFTKMPAEIRLVIYELVLSGNTIHMEVWNERKNPKIHTIPCRQPDRLLSRTHHCWHIKWVSDPDIPNRGIQDPERQRVLLLSLLLTCRKVYSEAIAILYANTFNFQNCAEFLKLPRFLPPQRFNAIRSLQLDYFMGEELFNPGSYGGPHWDFPSPLWEVIATMEGLRSLRVAFLVGPSHRSYWFRFQDHYLQPLRDVGISAHVELIMPFASCSMPDMGSSAFSVVIPEEDAFALLQRLGREEKLITGVRRP